MTTRSADMTKRSYRYLHLDVFTDHTFGGNQLAVFTSPQGLSTEEMQAITREMNFSECTFVFPPESGGTDHRVRIFTPGKELPMAGHPTIGTAFALAEERIVSPGQARVVFGEGVGPVPVDLVWEGGQLSFAWMTQLRPTFGRRAAAIEVVAAALGVEPAAIRSTGVPVQEVSCGVPFLMVPLATRASVDAASLDRAGVDRLRGAAGPGATEVFLFSTEPAGDSATAYSRMFAPGLGVAEDPATGAASGPLGSYLVRHGLVPPSAADRIVSLQGVKMGRPSRIHIAIDVEGGEITRVRVGGQSVLVGEGTIRI
jgi:trans-2,3-dihydro-3-hydroxyanthranilate isomerase